MLFRLRGWMRALVRAEVVEREMRDEMQLHLDRTAERLMARGMSADAARAEARREFGNLTWVQEEARDARGVRWLHDALQDLRIALRRIRRAPALGIAIVLTIAFGLGAAAAIFTTFEAALLDSLPYAQPERLVHMWELRAGTKERSPTSYPTLLDWRSRARSFAALEGYDPANPTVGLGDETRMLRGAEVTVGFFRLLGVRIAAGRDFVRDDQTTPAAGVAIVSERFARSLGGGMPLNRTVMINGTAHVIVGVLPTAFQFALLQDADVFMPLVASDQRRADRTERSIHVVGRLREHVTLEAARGELAALMSALSSEHPDALAGRTVVALPLRDALLGNMKPILTSLLVAVIFLLVIVGANLALLMLTRHVERMPELAMRFALGATRARVLRQLLVESLAPCLLGAVLAVAVGQLTASGLLTAIPSSVRIGMPYLENAGVDVGVFAVIAGLATVLAVTLGVGPALLVTKAVRRIGDSRTTVARGDRRLRRGLVVGQIAVTIVLLASAGLLVVSFRNLVHRDVGIRDPNGLVLARAPLSGSRYQGPLAQQQFYEALLARVAALPGVVSAGAIDEVPGSDGRITTFDVMDRRLLPSMQPRAALRVVGGRYFSTMGIPVLAGRAFEPGDRMDTPPVAVVSASFARLVDEDGQTIGRRFRLATTGDTEWDVVGVVGDVQTSPLDVDSPPVVYLSHLQRAENRMGLVVRTKTGAASVANELRAIVKNLDPGVPLYGVATLGEQLRESRAVFSRRLPMIVCGVFAAAALVLTLMALYAICMHEVLSRNREFGIRLALGGSPGSIRRSIFGDAMLLGASGCAIGGVVAILVSRSLRSIVFGIATTDWRVYGVVVAGVLASVLVAALGPALRAGAVNPSVVMRAE